MSVFFRSILSLSFSGTLLIILIFLCKPLLKDRISKRWQYYMWLVVIVRLLVPFSLPGSPVNVLFQKVDHVMIQMNESVPAVMHTPILEKLAIVLQNLWLVWLIGALLLLIRKITIYQGFVKYVRAGCTEISDIDLLNRLAQYGEQIGVKAPVELYSNSFVSSPMLIGFFKPCIVLQTTNLSDSDLRYTILHELTHYRHRDMFYKWIVQVTLCLHWFNPFVYLMCHEINRACELACDENIISRLETKEQETYGDMLLNAVGKGGSYRDSIASMTLYENKEMIKERLEAIKNFKKKTIWTTLGTIVLVIGLAAISTVIGAYAAPSITRSDPEADTALPVVEDEQGESKQSETVYVTYTTENSITVNVIEFDTGDNAERVNTLGLNEEGR